MISRVFVFLAMVFCPAVVSAGDDLAFDQRDNWQLIEPWMHDTQGDVPLDLSRAARMGKSLMIVWEQPGCLYCDRLYERNFKNPVIRDILDRHFLVMPLDMTGSRRMRARDGTEMTEAELARRLNVTGTPTTVVFNTGRVLADVGERAVAFRMPGYLTPFHYFTVLAYFLSDQHQDMTLREYTEVQARDFRRRGINPDRW